MNGMGICIKTSFFGKTGNARNIINSEEALYYIYLRSIDISDMISGHRGLTVLNLHIHFNL